MDIAVDAKRCLLQSRTKLRLRRCASFACEGVKTSRNRASTHDGQTRGASRARVARSELTEEERSCAGSARGVRAGTCSVSAPGKVKKN